MKKKKVVCKKFNWCIDIDCFVKQRFRTKSNMFQSNYVYRIVDLDKLKEIATLKDVFTKEQHIISLKQLNANFRPYYALTGHFCQGVTTEKNINIYDLKSDFISAKCI
jgi:hypothetical protein